MYQLPKENNNIRKLEYDKGVNDATEAAALHYSQIIEQKDKENESLKRSLEILEHNYQECDANRINWIDKSIEHEKQIEQLKAENQKILNDMTLVIEKETERTREVVKLQSQIKGLVEGLERERNNLYDSLPTGEISAFDLTTIIKKHIENLDTLTNYYNSTK